MEPIFLCFPVISKGQLIRNLTVYNYVKNCRYICHYDKTLKYEEYNSEKQSYLEIELGELVLKLIIYLILFSCRMETSKNSNSKHKSVEDSDDSEIDDIHQPAKRPRLRGKALNSKERGRT